MCKERCALPDDTPRQLPHFFVQDARTRPTENANYLFARQPTHESELSKLSVKTTNGRLPMSAARKAIFPHRQNRDGSYDSICPSCFLTIASAQCEDELTPLEKGHVCASSLLAERGVLVAEARSG
jgi:hypothetical protein